MTTQPAEQQRTIPPWMVAFVRFGPGRLINLVEGAGTLLTASWVLTAAHVVIDPLTTTAVIGQNPLSTADPKGMRAIKRVIPHPMYQPLQTPPPFDLALVELATPYLPDGQFPATVSLGLGGDFSPLGEVFGWGEIPGVPGLFSNQMKQIAVTVEDQVDREVFLATAASHLTTCYGDSGGPLLIHARRVWVQIGITSSLTVARQCRRAGIYTAVASNSAWIVDTLEAALTATADGPAPAAARSKPAPRARPAS